MAVFPRTPYRVPRTAYRIPLQKHTNFYRKTISQLLFHDKYFTQNDMDFSKYGRKKKGRREEPPSPRLRWPKEGEKGSFCIPPLRLYAFTPLRLCAFLIPAPSPLSPSLSPRPNVSAFQALPAADEPGLSFRLPGLKRLTVC